MNDQNKAKRQGRKPVPNLVDTQRLKVLIDTKKSRQIIADEIGCDVSTITKHYNGNNPVDLEMLHKYAKYFGVSTDYLLGLSDVATVDKDIDFINKYTGLSADSINMLHFYKREENYNQLCDFVNIILNNYIHSCLPEIYKLPHSVEKHYKEMRDFIKMYGEGKFHEQWIEDAHGMDEKISNFNDGLNGIKYNLSKCFDTFLDVYSMSLIDDVDKYNEVKRQCERTEAEVRAYTAKYFNERERSKDNVEEETQS